MKNNTMKKILLTTALIGLSTYASAAVLISGWSFTGATNANTTFLSDFSDVTGDGTGNANGTIYMDGTNGSDSFSQNATFGGAEAITTPGTQLPNSDLTTRFGTPSMTTSTNEMVQFVNGNTFAGPVNANGLSFVIAVDATAGLYENIVLSYGAGLQNSAGNTDISWSISYTSAEAGFGELVTDTISSSLASGGSALSHSFAGSASQFWIKGTIGGTNPLADGNPFVMDNIQITGDVLVPEPSTYAALGGILALCFVALRRRRK